MKPGHKFSVYPIGAWPQVAPTAACDFPHFQWVYDAYDMDFLLSSRVEDFLGDYMKEVEIQHEED